MSIKGRIIPNQPSTTQRFADLQSQKSKEAKAEARAADKDSQEGDAAEIVVTQQESKKRHPAVAPHVPVQVEKRSEPRVEKIREDGTVQNEEPEDAFVAATPRHPLDTVGDATSEERKRHPHGEELSQVHMLIRAFEERNGALRAQLESLRLQVQPVVQDLASSGFNPALASSKAADLRPLRGDMAAIKVELVKNHRRIKALRSGAYGLPFTSTARLSERLAELANLPEGQRRRFGIVALAKEVFPAVLPGGQGISRLRLRGDEIDYHRLGRYLALRDPVLALAQTAVALVDGAAGAGFDDEADTKIQTLAENIRRGRVGQELRDLAALADLADRDD